MLPDPFSNTLLRARGVAVITAMEDGMDREPDELVFLRATELGRVAVSNDSDFLEVAHRWQHEGHHFAGLIRVRQDNVSIGEVIEDIEIIVKVKEPDEMANSIEYVPFRSRR